MDPDGKNRHPVPAPMGNAPKDRFRWVNLLDFSFLDTKVRKI